MDAKKPTVNTSPLNLPHRKPWNMDSSISHDDHKPHTCTSPTNLKTCIDMTPTVSCNKTSQRKRCQQCKKKVGVLGFECSACNYKYCTSHRLPECHNCSKIETLVDIERNNLNKQLQKVTSKNENRLDRI